MPPAVLTLIAQSGTGKTTLLEKLIVEMKGRGYRVGAMKHDAHGLEIDHEGKDSWRLTQAGADTMVIVSSQKMAMIRQFTSDQEPPLEEILSTLFADVDLVLTEGFKKSALPKIEVHRKELGRPLLSRGASWDPALVALVTDDRAAFEVDVPVFDLDEIPTLCDWIETSYLSP